MKAGAPGWERPAEAVLGVAASAILLGMMLLVAHLRLSGFFELVSTWMLRRARHALVLLAATVGVAGLFSAFLVNDTICLVLTPLVLELTIKLDHLRVDEWKALSKDHAGYFLARIEPEVSVGKTRPREASGGAPGWTLLRVDKEAQAPFQVLTREHLRQLDVERCARCRGLPDAGYVEIADLILRHQRHRFRAKQLGSAEFAAMHEHLEESQIVARGSIEPAAARICRDRLSVREGDDAEQRRDQQRDRCREREHAESADDQNTQYFFRGVRDRGQRVGGQDRKSSDL